MVFHSPFPSFGLSLALYYIYFSMAISCFFFTSASCGGLHSARMWPFHPHTKHLGLRHSTKIINLECHTGTISGTSSSVADSAWIFLLTVCPTQFLFSVAQAYMIVNFSSKSTVTAATKHDGPTSDGTLEILISKILILYVGIRIISLFL